MSIARAEVAHLARLSRLALTDDELDHFAVQLDQIISAVAHVQEVAADGRKAQVILGADDKHLVFRSCVSVRLLDDGAVEVSLANRVACTNAFGRIYMALIARTHRKVVAPTMLAHAVDAALRSGASD